jgi:hypothetical protein
MSKKVSEPFAEFGDATLSIQLFGKSRFKRVFADQALVSH